MSVGKASFHGTVKVRAAGLRKSPFTLNSTGLTLFFGKTPKTFWIALDRQTMNTTQIAAVAKWVSSEEVRIGMDQLAHIAPNIKGLTGKMGKEIVGIAITGQVSQAAVKQLWNKVLVLPLTAVMNEIHLSRPKAGQDLGVRGTFKIGTQQMDQGPIRPQIDFEIPEDK